MKKIFYKKVNKNNNKEMFEFLKNHFEYFTMNSWNRETSMANNVKVYNLGLNGDCYKLLEMLQVDDYFTINSYIEDWEMEHEGYKVGFNGSSGGYLVLYNNDNNKHVLDDYITDSDNYEEFKNSVSEDYNSLKNYHNRLVEQVGLVQSFDALCDFLRDECQFMLDNCKIVEEEYTEVKTRKVLDWGNNL